MLFVNHRRSKLPRGRAVGTSRHDGGKRQKENPVRAHLYTTSWHPCGASLAGQGRTYAQPKVDRASSVPSESAIQPFANLAICKRAIAPKVFSPFEALASIGKIYTLRVIFARLLGVLRPLKPQKKAGQIAPLFSLLRQHFPGIRVTRSGLPVRSSDIPGFALPRKRLDVFINHITAAHNNQRKPFRVMDLR